MEPVKRTLHLKVIRYASGRKKDFSPVPIHKLLAEIAGKASTVGKRLQPDTPQPNSDITHKFFNNFIAYGGNEVTFQYCTYLPGQVPVHMHPDLNAQNVDMQLNPVTDAATGTQLEMVNVTHILAFGSVLIIESSKGYGGIHSLANYLTYLIHRYHDEKYPSLHLMDVAEQELMQTIKRGGGVAEVIMNMEHPSNDNSGAFAKLLGSARKSLSNTKTVQISWKSSTTMNSDEVMKAFDEAKDIEDAVSVDKIMLVLKSGERIDNLNRYKIRKPIEVSSIGGRVPNSDEVRTGLRSYLTELQIINDGVRVVTDDGNISPLQAVANGND